MFGQTCSCPPMKNLLQEFKDDLGATGDKKTDEDKKDIQQRQDDKLGLKRDEKDAERADSKK